VRLEHKTTKVMICTYRWCLSVNRELETEQDKSWNLSALCSAQWAGKQKYSNNRHCVKHLWKSFWWGSRTLGQCQVTKLAFSTGFQRVYASSNVGNLHLSEGMSAQHYSCSIWRTFWNTQAALVQSEMRGRWVGFDDHELWLGNTQWGRGCIRYRTNALLSEVVSIYTLVVVISCSLQ
jgi:hypothetical protein